MVPMGAVSSYPWDEELVFDALRDVVRRRIFVLLAKKGWTPAIGLNVSRDGREARPGYSLVDFLTTHLAVMVKAGIVVKMDNPGDGRRPLYDLSPNVPMTVTDDLIIVDFGFLAFRIKKG